MKKWLLSISAGAGAGIAIYFIIFYIAASGKPFYNLTNQNEPLYLSDENPVEEYVSFCISVCDNLNRNETAMQSMYDLYTELSLQVNETFAREIIKLPEDIYCDALILNETFSNIDCNQDGDLRDICRCPELYSCYVLNRLMVCLT
ncbi:MAG: hypothetical protein PHW96_03810 [Candidatus Nanoarchaeia archaeon]|nr:hypothetical protein [Candidatus Nanoarchaeia archaeon]